MAKGKSDAPMSVPRYLRNFRGLSMQDLAAQVGVTFSTIFKAEHGQNLSLGSLKKLSDYFAVSLDCLARNDLAAAATALYSPAIRSNRMKEALREKQKKMDEIGDRGEQIVIRQERIRLEGSPLAQAVNGNVSDDLRAGFDILTFDETGEPIYIEVKTTVDGEDAPFYMSRRELEFARHCHKGGLSYQVHRVYELDNADNCKVKILDVGELLRDFEFIPVTYLVRRTAV